MRYLKIAMLWVGFVAASVGAMGCNTLEGIGEDTAAVGRGIQDVFDGDEEAEDVEEADEVEEAEGVKE